MRTLGSGALARIVIAIGILLGTSAGAAERSGNPVKATEPARHVVDGFRSAKFGMTEAAVREAIAKDFGAKPDAITSEMHPSEQTTILGANVSELLPNTGPATVSYTLGFQSKALIQVSVLWAGSGGKIEDLQSLIATANVLRDYFLGLGLVPETIAVNKKAEDGSLVVFQGEDAAGHLVLVSLAIGKTDGAKAGDATVRFDGALLVRYVENYKSPDVMRVKAGAF